MSQFFKEKLGDLYKINTGKANTVDQVEDGQYSFFGRGKKIMKSNSYLYDCDAIIIAGEGTSFFPKQFSGKFNLHQRAYAIHSSNGKVDIQYLNYFLFFNEKYFQNVAVGATAKSLRLRHFTDLEIPFPSINEQKRIVEKLDACMEQIDKAIKNVEQNIQNAEELFKSQLNEIFSQKAGEWIEEKLGNCLKLKSGEGLTSKNMNQNGNYDVYGGNGVVGKHDMFNMQGSQVIIGRVGAHCGNVRIVNEKIWLTDNAFKVSEFFYDFDKLFLTFLLNFKNLRNFARQSAQPVISNSSMKDVTLCFPKNIELQKSIASQFEELKSKIKVLEFRYRQELIALDDLKKSILEKAFNGEL